MNSRSLTIGILEDEVLIAEALRELLSNLGYENVLVANTFEEGLEFLSKQPDLVLLDINLNGQQDGIDFASRVRQQLDIPIIFISSHSDQQTVQRASAIKPNGFLLKPFNQERLYTAIETALANFEEIPEEQAAPPSSDTIFVKENNLNYSKLRLSELIWFKSEGNYLELYTNERHYLIRSSIRGFLTRYPSLPFVRTHKSHAVRMDAIDGISHSSVRVGSTELPLSRNYREQLLQQIEKLS